MLNNSSFNKLFTLLKISPDLSKLIISFFSANFLVILVQTVSGLLVTRMIRPEDMGLFTTASIVTIYLPFFLLGTNNGLNRELSFLNGQGKTEEIPPMRNTAFAWAFFMSGITFIAVALIGIYYQLKQQTPLAYAFYATAIMSAFYPLTTILEITFRTSNDFIRLSKIKILNLVVAISTIPLVYYLGYNGMLARSILIAFSLLGLMYYFKSYPIKIEFSKKHFITLLKIGIPIFFWSYIYSIYTGLDKVFIASHFSERYMGLLTPSIQVTIGLSILPSSIFQIIYPRLGEQYGRHGTISSLQKLAFTPLKYLAIGMLPILAIATLLIGPFVELVLPNYVEGIPAARWAILAVYFKCLGGPADILTLIGKLHYYGIVTALSAGVFFVLFKIFLSYGWELEAVTASFAFSTLFFNIAIALVVYWLIKKEKQSV